MQPTGGVGLVPWPRSRKSRGTQQQGQPFLGPFRVSLDVLCASAGSVGNDEMSLTETVIGKTGLRAGVGERRESKAKSEEGEKILQRLAGWLVGNFRTA